MNINIDTSLYRAPTQKEIDKAKSYVLRRESYAQALDERIDTILTEAAGEIAQICLKYNIPAKDFTLTSNEQMFEEVSEIMDDADERIMSLIEDYSVIPAKDNGYKKLILLWIATLGRGGMNLQQTLSGYMKRYLYDTEALIAAYKLRMENNPSFTQASAITQIKAALHSVYTTPAVVAAMRGLTQMQAMYIRTHGVHRDDVPLPIVGRSNSNANNVISMAGTTMRMAWMRELGMEYRESEGIAGFYVLRGSSYDCPICNEQATFHPINDIGELPMYHVHCQCYAVPVYYKQQ